jgi:hypothetical protein
VHSNDLVEIIVLTVHIFIRVKTKIYDRMVTTLVHCFFLGDIAFEELGIWMLYLGCGLCCSYNDWITLAGSFFCRAVMSLRHFIVAENIIGIFMILIYSFY